MNRSRSIPSAPTLALLIRPQGRLGRSPGGATPRSNHPHLPATWGLPRGDGRTEGVSREADGSWTLARGSMAALVLPLHSRRSH